MIHACKTPFRYHIPFTHPPTPPYTSRRLSEKGSHPLAMAGNGPPLAGGATYTSPGVRGAGRGTPIANGGEPEEGIAGDGGDAGSLGRPGRAGGRPPRPAARVPPCPWRSRRRVSSTGGCDGRLDFALKVVEGPRRPLPAPPLPNPGWAYPTPPRPALPRLTCVPTTTICGSWMMSAPTVLKTSCSLLITGINASMAAGERRGRRGRQ